MIDDEDRNAIGMGVIRIVAFVALALLVALVAGAAIRFFQFTSGI